MYIYSNSGQNVVYTLKMNKYFAHLALPRKTPHLCSQNLCSVWKQNKKVPRSKFTEHKLHNEFTEFMNNMNG